MKSLQLSLLTFFILLLSLAGKGEQKFDHSKWNQLLQKHVSAKGNVNYEGFANDKAELDAYLSKIAAVKPNSNWTRNEAMAYWINAYNAFTIELMLNNYPLKSIMDVNGGKAWDLKFIDIKGEKYSLNNMEHDILREKYFDPRIHFAVNCASISCPKLSNSAYFAEGLDAKLDKAAKEFINNSSKNDISAYVAQISKLFDWYKDDFSKNGTVKDYINEYSTTKLTVNNISYKEYNWNINK